MATKSSGHVPKVLWVNLLVETYNINTIISAKRRIIKNKIFFGLFLSSSDI